MTSEKLIAVLEEIRDQQRLQIANFEQALSTQKEAIGLQRQGRRILLFLVAAPWAVLVFLLGLFFVKAMTN